MGFTPKGYMQQVRFHQARKLLEDKRYSTVKTVSYSVGFKDEKYFARQFKQRFGKNPSEYL
jgi:two-component system response regulator YesN